MRLDPVADQHVVGLEGQAVEIERKTFGGVAHDDRFHARTDRAADRFFGNAVRLDELPLALGRRAAVTAHGGNDERFGPQAGQMPDDRPDDRRQIGDSPAADGDRHALPRANLLPQVQPCELGVDLARHVVDSLALERLANSEDFGGRMAKEDLTLVTGEPPR